MSEIREKFIPDPDTGVKKEPDPDLYIFHH
jgi:hypothetical protein